MDKSLCVTVVGYAAASAMLSEAHSWLMIFRKPDYHRLKNSLDKANQRLDKHKLEEPVAALKTTTVSTKGSKGKDKKGKEEVKDKKLAMLEKDVEATTRALTVFKVRAPPCARRGGSSRAQSHALLATIASFASASSQ